METPNFDININAATARQVTATSRGDRNWKIATIAACAYGSLRGDEDTMRNKEHLVVAEFFYRRLTGNPCCRRHFGEFTANWRNPSTWNVWEQAATVALETYFETVNEGRLNESPYEEPVTSAVWRKDDPRRLDPDGDISKLTHPDNVPENEKMIRKLCLNAWNRLGSSIFIKRYFPGPEFDPNTHRPILKPIDWSQIAKDEYQEQDA